MNHTRAHDIHLLAFHHGITVIEIVERTSHSRWSKLFDNIVLRLNLALPIRSDRCRNTLFCQDISRNIVSCTLYCREEYELCRSLICKIPIKDTLRQSCVDFEINISCTLVAGVVRLSSKMDYGVNFRYGTIVQIIPAESLCHAFFFGGDNIQAVDGVVWRKIFYKV